MKKTSVDRIKLDIKKYHRACVEFHIKDNFKTFNSSFNYLIENFKQKQMFLLHGLELCSFDEGVIICNMGLNDPFDIQRGYRLPDAIISEYLSYMIVSSLNAILEKFYANLNQLVDFIITIDEEEFKKFIKIREKNKGTERSANKVFETNMKTFFQYLNWNEYKEYKKEFAECMEISKHLYGLRNICSHAYGDLMQTVDSLKIVEEAKNDGLDVRKTHNDKYCQNPFDDYDNHVSVMEGGYNPKCRICEGELKYLESHLKWECKTCGCKEKVFEEEVLYNNFVNFVAFSQKRRCDECGKYNSIELIIGQDKKLYWKCMSKKCNYKKEEKNFPFRNHRTMFKLSLPYQTCLRFIDSAQIIIKISSKVLEEFAIKTKKE